MPTLKQQADAPEWQPQVPVLPLSSCVTLSRLISILLLHFLICTMGIIIIAPSQDTPHLSLLGGPMASISYNHLAPWSNVFSFLFPLVKLHGLQIFISSVSLLNHVCGLHRLSAHNNADILLNLKANIKEEKYVPTLFIWPFVSLIHHQCRHVLPTSRKSDRYSKHLQQV